jgi:hypothetical protein
MTRLEGVKGKINLTFFLSINRVALLRHYVLTQEMVVPSKSGRFSVLAASVIIHVSPSNIDAYCWARIPQARLVL